MSPIFKISTCAFAQIKLGRNFLKCLKLSTFICNQYYSTVVHLLIIYIAIFRHGTSLTTDTGDAGSSPHVDRCFLSDVP